MDQKQLDKICKDLEWRINYRIKCYLNVKENPILGSLERVGVHNFVEATNYTLEVIARKMNLQYDPFPKPPID